MKKNLKALRITGFVLVASLLLILLLTFKGLTVQEILSYSPESPFVAFAVLIGFYCLKSVVIFLPLTALFVSTGIMFPAPLAIAITYLGLFFELSIGYWIGGYFANGSYEKIIAKNKTIRSWLKPSAETFNAVCFFMALLPGPLPLDITSMLLGAAKISYFRFILFSLLGLSPGMLAWVVAGGSISTPLSKEFLVPFGIALVIALITFIILQIALKKEADGGEADR